MADKPTLGQAIDQCIQALEPLEAPARKTALSAICSYLQIQIDPSGKKTDPTANQPPGGQGDQRTPPPADPPGAGGKIIDIRALTRQKQPNSAVQMSCVVAYYLSECAPDADRKESVNKSDLEKYFKQANFQLPESFQDVLPNAKKSGYFDSASRGAYRLNAVGYNLVAHNLPAGAGEE